MAWYAWSGIKHTDGKGNTKVIARGEKVVKSDLPGITDANWQAMIDAGTLRDRQFPAPEGYDGSAIDFLRESLQEAQAVSPVDEEEAAAELEEIASLEK